MKAKSRYKRPTWTLGKGQEDYEDNGPEGHESENKPSYDWGNP